MEQQRTEAWHKKRTGRVTGSNVGAILGLSPFMKREDVMRNMVREYHNAPSEFAGNAATNYGTYNEHNALADYELKFDTKVVETGFHTYEYWLGASPDGFINNDGLIEVKCPYGLRDNNPPEFKSIDYQSHYWMQIQIQLLVTGRQWCHFYQWSAHGEMLETVQFNQLAIEEYLPKLKEFYNEYLVERELPHAQKYLEEKRQQVRCKGQVDRYLMIAEQIKELETEKKRLLDEIVKLADGKDSEINGHKLTKVTKAGSISYAKAVKELLPDVDLADYTGDPVSYWRLS